jgi:hypothetical protein
MKVEEKRSGLLQLLTVQYTEKRKISVPREHSSVAISHCARKKHVCLAFEPLQKSFRLMPKWSGQILVHMMMREVQME